MGSREGACDGGLCNVPMYECIANCSRAAAGERACQMHAEDECIRRREGWQHGETRWPFAKLRWTLATGPPTCSVGVQTSNCRWRLSSSSVGVRLVVCKAQHMQCNAPGAARGGPVVLRPVRATPCLSRIKATSCYSPGSPEKTAYNWSVCVLITSHAYTVASVTGTAFSPACVCVCVCVRTRPANPW